TAPRWDRWPSPCCCRSGWRSRGDPRGKSAPPPPLRYSCSCATGRMCGDYWRGPSSPTGRERGAGDSVRGVIAFEEARSYVLERVRVSTPVRVPVDDAVGLVLAHDVVAPEAVPPFPNTAMDGFAVRAADTANAPAKLTVVGTLAA